MGESDIKKGLELNGSDANIRKSRCIRRILVEGYDTSLCYYDVDTALRKIFASCGEITHVYIPRKNIGGPLNRFAFIYIRGEDAEEKALKLSGSDVGGWNVVAKAYPFQETSLDTELAPMRAHGQFNQLRMAVTGYNTSLPVDNVESMLTRLVPSCNCVIIPEEKSGGLNSIALLFFGGADAAEKALERSGSDVGGWNFEVIKVMPPRKYKMGYCRSRPLPNEANMTTKKSKNKTTEAMPPRRDKIGYSRPRPLPTEANVTTKKNKTTK